MNRCTFIPFLFVLCAPALAQTSDSRAIIQQALGFEDQVGSGLTGWHSTPAGTAVADSQVVHSGHWSARLRLDAQSVAEHATITRSIPSDFHGSTVELHGYLRMQNVSGFAGFWIREDADGEALHFANMQSRRVNGTHDWAQYSISLPIDPRAHRLVFGIQLIGSGTLWADDAELLVDGKPIADAASATPPPGLPADHEFDLGSHISLTDLTAMQVANLATLARVWGFLKYHDPVVTDGQRHWDYELLRILPTILAAPDRDHANEALFAWIDKLGPVPACAPCTPTPSGDLDEKPAIAWIRDRALLGGALSQRLQSIYTNRTGHQFFVTINRAAGNAFFDHELAYPLTEFPDPGYQLLALFRWWNIVQYWAPYRETAGQNWIVVLSDFIPRLALARDKVAYQLVLFEMIAKANDAHANLWSSLPLLPPGGACAVPAALRFVGDKAVVYRLNAPDTGLAPGDILEAIDDVSIQSLIRRMTPYYSNPNDAVRQRDLAMNLTRGACGPASLNITRGGKHQYIATARTNFTFSLGTHDQPGDTFRLLSPDVAYIKLSSAKVGDVPTYFERARGTRGLIIDIRNYPLEFMPFALGAYLATRPTPFVTFTIPDLANPGATRFADDTNPLDHSTIDKTGAGSRPVMAPTIAPGPIHYAGKIVILVDEVTQSSAEYTAMALRAMPNALVVGSTTAGADGNVTDIPLPGGLGTVISGLGVFYPDRRPTQRVGIVPNIVARPTVQDIAAGRDEALQIAVNSIEHRRVPKPEGQ